MAGVCLSWTSSVVVEILVWPAEGCWICRHRLVDIGLASGCCLHLETSTLNVGAVVVTASGHRFSADLVLAAALKALAMIHGTVAGTVVPSLHIRLLVAFARRPISWRESSTATEVAHRKIHVLDLTGDGVRAVCVVVMGKARNWARLVGRAEETLFYGARPAG